MIYHYTTIETLALILESKKIRFNNLTDVDDMLEGDLFEKRSLAQHIFVSCWSKEKEENIALWKMYNHGKGVRIGLPSNPWRKVIFDTKEWEEKGVKIQFDPSQEYISPFEFDDVFGANHMIIPPYFFPNNTAFAKQVEYLSAKELKVKYKGLYSELMKGKCNIQLSINPLDFGRYKHNRWEFQKEYRFVLFICPLHEKPDFFQLNSPETISNTLIDYIKNEKTSPLKDFYVQLADESLRDMEVMVGPLCSKADEIIIDALIKKYQLNTSLINSEASIRK
ncbi:hypothetical protein [Albibacterium sp.]|uniref:hypothetical protein n=1 Tax=Albibacterium sp. TaxID=2952885 RepID=UPI002C787EFC|nr:hypothetical protein [Albibacterium sp.]HUH19388.1 hypothetical protein [Albibacterium sp.]